MIVVTNTGDMQLADRYDGQDYLFNPGESIQVDEAVARHIFGYGDADKTPYLVRQGWMQNSRDLDHGMSILAGFKFSLLNGDEPEPIIPLTDLAAATADPAPETSFDASDFQK